MSAQADTDRVYLFVPPEEGDEVRSQGAHLDAAKKRWYIESDQSVESFSRWLPSSDSDGDEFAIHSNHAFVAETTIPCQACSSMIHAICIHCGSGTILGECLLNFTVSDVSEMDASLAHQLEPWPHFRKVGANSDEALSFANHCPHCGARQDDMLLHSEPDHPFFDISHAKGSIRLSPLNGMIRLTGDEHFVLE